MQHFKASVEELKSLGFTNTNDDHDNILECELANDCYVDWDMYTNEYHLYSKNMGECLCKLSFKKLENLKDYLSVFKK